MNYVDRLNDSVLLGVNFLHSNQLSYGEFKSFKSSDKSMVQSNQCLTSSPYITTFILQSISFIKEYKKIDEMVEKSLQFLLESIETPGVWRFYNRNNKIVSYKDGFFRKINIGIVPDLDDTACSSHCLKANKIIFPDNKQLFYSNKTLQDIFHTWFLKEKTLIGEQDYIPHTNNICCGVNANIVMYLGDCIETQGAIKYINDVVAKGYESKESIYFPNIFVFYYLISRAYYQGVYSLEESRNQIICKILYYLDSNQYNMDIVSIILSITSLMNFNSFSSPLRKWIDVIINSQSADGSWQISSFFIDASNHYGSKELTTAIALEAISRSTTICT